MPNARQVVLAAALTVLPGTALAGGAFTAAPLSPQVDPPTDIPEGQVAFVCAGRIGDLGGPATFELEIGPSTSAPAVTEQHAWGNDQGEPFTLVYDPAVPLATFTLAGRILRFSPAGDVNSIFVRARAADAGAFVHVDHLVLDGRPIEETASAHGPEALDILWIYDDRLADGFALSGIATLAWVEPPPGQSRLAFQIKVGEWFQGSGHPTTATEATSWGSVKALFR